jgi:hypothetical protein
VIKRHPEMAGNENLVKQAIGTPFEVRRGNGPDDKVFVGDIVAGRGFALNGRTIVAIVNYSKGSLFLTAYSTTLPPKGSILWKRP